MVTIMLESRGQMRCQRGLVYNGVRQGGIWSPFLFGIYVNELSIWLQLVHVGGQF